MLNCPLTIFVSASVYFFPRSSLCWPKYTLIDGRIKLQGIFLGPVWSPVVFLAVGIQSYAAYFLLSLCPSCRSDGCKFVLDPLGPVNIQFRFFCFFFIGV